MNTLKRVDADLAAPEACRVLGISTTTFYKWRAKYGGIDTSIIARMKELEAENARLKEDVYRRETQGRDRDRSPRKKSGEAISQT